MWTEKYKDRDTRIQSSVQRFRISTNLSWDKRDASILTMKVKTAAMMWRRFREVLFEFFVFMRGFST